jgi:hypothetical protein
VQLPDAAGKLLRPRPRTGTERTFSTTKDPASNDISRGWCRLTGLAPIAQFAAWPRCWPSSSFPAAARRARPARKPS